MRRGIIGWYAIGFGLGLSPIVPGTCGTLLAFPLAYSLASYPILGYLGIAGLSYYAAKIEGKRLRNYDHPSIVCDEIIGILPLLFWFPRIDWIWVFLWFRALDIVKPWPISWADRKIKGPLGCLLDDVLAGLIAFLILLALL